MGDRRPNPSIRHSSAFPSTDPRWDVLLQDSANLAVATENLASGGYLNYVYFQKKRTGEILELVVDKSGNKENFQLKALNVVLDAGVAKLGTPLAAVAWGETTGAKLTHFRLYYITRNGTIGEAKRSNEAQSSWVGVQIGDATGFTPLDVSQLAVAARNGETGIANVELHLWYQESGSSTGAIVDLHCHGGDSWSKVTLHTDSLQNAGRAGTSLLLVPDLYSNGQGYLGIYQTKNVTNPGWDEFRVVRLGSTNGDKWVAAIGTQNLDFKIKTDSPTRFCGVWWWYDNNLNFWYMAKDGHINQTIYYANGNAFGATILPLSDQFAAPGATIVASQNKLPVPGDNSICWPHIYTTVGRCKLFELATVIRPEDPTGRRAWEDNNGDYKGKLEMLANQLYGYEPDKAVFGRPVDQIADHLSDYPFKLTWECLCHKTEPKVIINCATTADQSAVLAEIGKQVQLGIYKVSEMAFKAEPAVTGDYSMQITCESMLAAADFVQYFPQ